MPQPEPELPREEPGDRPTLSRWKKVLFAVIVLVAVPALGEVLLALCGVRPAVVLEDPYVGFQSSIPLFVKEVDRSGKTIYRTAPNKLGPFNEQSFPADKEADAYRIFCLGGSTTFGRPYDDATSFVGWLRRFLEAADPSTDWQVVNCGGVSYASYRVATLMEELIRYAPDLFIIYTGHNEFLERRTYRGIIEASPVMTELGLLMHRSRIVSLARSGFRRLVEDPRAAAQDRYQLTGEVTVLLDTSAGLDLYHRDDELRRQTIDHYQFNLGRMVTLARSVGAEVIFLRPAANLKDFSPFKSQHRDDVADHVLAEWWNLFDQGVASANTEEYAAAREAFEQALQLDDRHARLHYELGNVLFAAGEPETARAAYERALVEDVCPLRMLPRMQGVLSSVARQHHVEVIDFAGVLQEQSRRAFGHPMLGQAYFLDHVHPTIAAHRLLGRLILDHLIDRGTVTPVDDWGDTRMESIVAEVENTLDQRDHALARSKLVRVLRWAGKADEADRLVAEVAEVLTDHAPTVAMFASFLKRRGKLDQAVELYERALQLDPTLDEAAINLGSLLVVQGRVAEAIGLYQRVLSNNPEDALAYRKLGAALSRMGRFAEAVEAFSRASHLDPADARAKLGLGEALMRQGQFNEALARFDAALRLNPRAAKALILKGVVQSRRGRLDEAIRYYQRALRIDRHNAEAHYNLGVARLRRRELDAAVEHFEQAVRVAPDLVEAHFNLAIARAQRGEYDRAAVHLERVVELTPGDRLAYDNLAMAYLATGRFAPAIEALEKGLRAIPDDGGLTERLAWLLATCPEDNLRDGAQALRLARQVCAGDSTDNPRHLDILAAAYAETGRFDEAVHTTQQAIEKASLVDDPGMTERLQGRLKLYQAGRPYRINTPPQGRP